MQFNHQRRTSDGFIVAFAQLSACLAPFGWQSITLSVPQALAPAVCRHKLPEHPRDIQLCMPLFLATDVPDGELKTTPTFFSEQ